MARPPPAPPTASSDASPDVSPEAGRPTAAELLALRAELAAARTEAARLRELLDVAQEFGRLGTWTRDLRSGRASWDRAMLRLWGLEGDSDSDISLARMQQQIVEQDRERVARYAADSEQRCGRYAVRFRLRTAAGQLRRLHAQWEVLPAEDGAPGRTVGMILDDTDTLAADLSGIELGSQLALAIELGNIQIWRHDLDRGRIVWSAQGWRSLGLTPRPEGLSVEEVRALIHPEDLPRVMESAQEALASPEPVDLEARYRHSDGHWRWQLLRRSVLRDAQGAPLAFLGVALDITERRAEQRRAQAMAERFGAVTRAAGIGHWVNELARGRLEWSPECRAIHGLGRDEALPSPREWLEQWVHPDDRERAREAMVQGVQRAGPAGLDLALRIVRRNGEVRQLSSHTRIEQGDEGEVIFGALIDVTEQLRSQDALRMEQERKALALRSAGIGTWEYEMDRGHVYWDAQMWRLRGCEPETEAPDEARRTAWVHPEDRALVRERIANAEAHSQPLEHNFRVIWPDGSVHWLASRATELTDNEGRRRRIGVNWDITNERMADEARRETELARRQSQAKSQFLARMSHELRTPLNAVLGFAQLMQGDEEGADAASATRLRRLAHVHSAGSHLLALINDVLTLSGVEGGEVTVAAQPVALAPLLHELLPMLAALAQARRIRLQPDLPQGLHVRGDATRLRQVLLNLLGNAVKYNRPGGLVRVSAQRLGDGPTAGRVRVLIEDTGIGLTDAQQRHLFEPFNRLGAEEGEVEGTGIGLAIVKALVERMGGVVSVQSRAGVGSVFGIELPLAEAGDAAAADLAHPESTADSNATSTNGPPQRQHRLLYIEDNPVNALIISELVARRRDLVLHVAVDGESGVAQARSLRPELVLLDMQLPDIDGFEVLQRLRAEPSTAQIPVIALSANAMPEDINRALAAGMSDYWTKPLDFKAFMAGLEALFGKAA